MLEHYGKIIIMLPYLIVKSYKTNFVLIQLWRNHVVSKQCTEAT